MSKRASIDRAQSVTPMGLGGYAGSCSMFLNPLEASCLNRPIAMESASFHLVRSTFKGEVHKVGAEGEGAMNTGLLADCAAVVIQCGMRKHLAVKEAQRRRVHRSKTSDNDVAESIAIDVPSEFQGLHGVSFDADAKPKKKKKEFKMPQTAADIYAAETSEDEDEEADRSPSYGLIEDMAALTIQTKARQHSAKTRVNGLKKKRQLDFEREVEVSLESCAAVTLQSAQRRHNAQVEVKRLKIESQPNSARGLAADKTNIVTATKSSPTREKFSKKSKASSSLPLPTSSGVGLNALFYASSSLLLNPQSRIGSQVSSALWGVRLLHAVAMECKNDGGKAGPSTDEDLCLPALEATNWVQGALASVLVESRPLTKSPEPNALNRPGSANRLAPLEGKSGTSATTTSPQRPGSANIKLAPLKK